MTGLVTTYHAGFVNAPNIKEAIRSFEEDGMPYVIVMQHDIPMVGTFVDEKDLTQKGEVNVKEIDEVESAYSTFSDPRNITKDMTYDDFMDWLDLSRSEQDIVSAIVAFEKVGLKEHVKIMKQYLKDNYGDKKEDEEET